METQTLSFWTTGENMTTLVRDLFQGGSFWNALEILKDGNMPAHIQLEFLQGKWKLEGDSRKGDLFIVKDDKSLNTLVTGWRTYCNMTDRSYVDFSYDYERKDKHLKSLFGLVSPDEFISAIKYELLNNFGYKVHFTPPKVDKEFPILHGAFLQDGVFIECGFQEHSELYPILRALNLSDRAMWNESRNTIHVSSGLLTGGMSFALQYAELWDDEVKISQELRDSLFQWRNHINSFYGEKTSVVDSLRKITINEISKGAKYGNLRFLQINYSSLINTPKICLSPFGKVYSIRTSPERSLAGILNSKFGVNQKNLTTAKEEIYNDWEAAKELRSGNKLHLFYQKHIKGINGVCHYKKGHDFVEEFSYSIGKQHEVVSGKKTNKKLSIKTESELKLIAHTLFKDLKRNVQLEFVVNKDKLTIVQLRTINIPVGSAGFVPKDVIAWGNSFTKGKGTFSKEECIIVDGEIESNEVVGKKAILVRGQEEFSHALALSQSLGIPSIYGIGNVEIPERFYLNTTGSRGFIQTAKNN